MGGIWSNNTQGVGVNVAPAILSNMRVIAAASGGINIATGDAIGQDAPPATADYQDSFAFVPGLSGNQRITVTLYVAAGYSPSDSHEMELILGCTTSAGYHKWIECNWGIGGYRQMVLLDGAPKDFTVLSPNDTGAASGSPRDGDVWVAELYRSTNTIKTYVNGAPVLSLTDSRISSLGSGAGIAAFRRTASGTTAANRYGFKNFKCEPF